MLLVAVAFSLATQDTSRAAVVPPGSYADAATADLVAHARAARQRNERLVTSYTATVTQRIGVSIHALSRDRMLFRQELAAHIEWYRDRPSRIEVVGAREAVPVFSRDDQVPDDLRTQVRWLVINPAEDYLRVVGADSDGFVYPIRPRGEDDYQFASGDTTTITLPSGSTVRLLELKVTPRRADFRLMSGSLWFDADSYGLVRAVFRPARPFVLRRDADSSDRGDIPWWLNVSAELKYVTLEYGLYEFRWWIPRYIAIDAIGTMGSMIDVPVRYERVYSDYHVEGGTPPPVGSTFRAAGTTRNGRGLARAARDSARARAGVLRAAGTAVDSLAADSIVAKIASDSITRRSRLDSLRQAYRDCVRSERDSAKARARRERRGVQVEVRFSDACRQMRNNDSSLVVVVPSDSVALLNNPQLGPPILDMGDVISAAEIGQLGREIAALSDQPWQFAAHLPKGFVDLLGHMRYNRVEALSIGLGGEIDFGRLKADGLGRIGLADGEPNFEVGLTRPTTSARFRVGAYRRLAAANPDMDPLGLGNSLSALLEQRDDGMYFRSLGAELTGAAVSGWYGWRVFAERQRSAAVGTQASLPHLFDRADSFRTNIVALGADQAGASLTVHGTRVVSRALSLGAEATVDGATGTYRYARGALTLRSTLQLTHLPAIGLEAAAGSSAGTLPVQSGFFLGGPPTLRGYDGGVFTGDAFWRGRLELGTRLPAARVMLFSDAGWAGPRAAFQSGRASWGGGVGFSFLDGLIRFDLARAFSTPKGWRFDVYLDAIL